MKAQRLIGRIALALIATLVLSVVLHKRATMAIRWKEGKVEVAHGCTVLSQGIFDDEDRFESTADQISFVQSDGPLAMYDTPVGTIWYPAASWTLPVVVEKSETDEYKLRSLVKSGAVVLDIGANVGTETRTAVTAGAHQVIAVEPAPLNVECLRRNLVSEIREGRVMLIAKGAWDHDDVLPLHLDHGNAGDSSFVWQPGGHDSVDVPVTTIDHLVAEFNLSKVSLIKIHAEGAETRILDGAAETIRRFHPQIAVTLEHHLDDTDVLPRTALHIWPGYRVQRTSCTKTFNRIHPATALLLP